MKTIPCTIRTLSDHGEDCWMISVSVDVVKNATVEITCLLSGDSKQIVFLDRKTDLIVTADSVTFRGRKVSITRSWLECIEKLFSSPCRPGYSHIDADFSDKHGDICITVRVV